MNTVKHDAATWFAMKGKTPLEFFEQDFEYNTMGSFKVPASTARRFDLSQDDEANKLFTSIANIYIQAVVKLKYNILKKVPFAMLEPQDQDHLLQTICEAVQHAVLNTNVWQRLNGSNTAVGGFTFNVDNTPWLLTSDMFGKIGWTLLNNSEVDEYSIVGEGDLYTSTANNNIKVLRVIDIDDNVPAIIWDQY